MTHNAITLAIIQDVISEVTCLFSLPEVYLRIRELMDDKYSNLDDFSKIVSTDPNLSASVLKIVNSAYFGFTGQISNIQQANTLLGIGMLHDLALSICAVGSFSMPNDLIKLSDFWRRSLYCGVLAKLIAEQKHLKDPGSLFVIGLLHEIGHLLFFFKFPELSLQAQAASVHTERSLVDIEREIFCLHYGEAGQRLMQAWHLPVNLQRITQFQPEPEQAHEFIAETAIVHLAHHHACAKERGDKAFNTLDTQAWQFLELTPELITGILAKADLMSRDLEKLILH